MSPDELAAAHDAGMAELFPFRFFDPIRRRWIRARYKATPEEIAARYEKWEITGPGWTPSGCRLKYLQRARRAYTTYRARSQPLPMRQLLTVTMPMMGSGTFAASTRH